MSLVRSLIRRGLGPGDAEHYAALIDDFSAKQAELLARLEGVFAQFGEPPS